MLPIYRRVPWMPWKVPYEPRQLLFVAGMLALSVAGLALAMAAVTRDWHIESGKRLIYWSIGGVALAGVSSVATRVGTNLPLLQKLDLPQSAHLLSIQSDGFRGVLVMWTDGTDGTDKERFTTLIQPFRITATGVELARPIPVEHERLFYVNNSLWVPEHPMLLYVAGARLTADGQQIYPTLSVVDLSGPSTRVRTQSFPEEASESLVFFNLYEWRNRLYGVGDKKRGSFDLSDPLKPNLISIENSNRSPAPLNRADQLFLDDRSGELNSGKIALAEIPGLPPRQRLELVLNNDHETFSGNVLTRVDWDRLTTYQLGGLTDSSATFRRLGRYVPTPLELLYGNGVSQSVQSGNLLFEIPGRGSLDGSHLAVFRVDGPSPRPIGHFAIPSEPKLEIRCVLPDGRLFLTAGDHRIYLLGPPPRS